MAERSHAVISGGGVGGLTAALALARAGLRVTVFERAEDFGDVGAGLQLAPNATRRLRALGLLERVERHGLAVDQARLRRARDGADLARAPLGAIAELRWGAPYLVIHRADLLGVLVAACEAEPAIELRRGVAVGGFAVASGGVEVAKRRGDELGRVNADVLIAADGLRSAQRERFGFGLGDAPVWSGRVAWRALAPSGAVPEFARKYETGLWLGPRAHLVHYPLRNGELINIVAITEDGWRGADASDLWDAAGDKDVIARGFERWHPDARALIAAAPEWRRWPVFDRAPTRRWTAPQGAARVALLGDAAHPMTPFLAQGAAQAIEDASALGDAFARLGGDIGATLAAYENARAARAAKVVLASRRQGGIYHMGFPLAVARDLTLARLSPEAMLSRLDWLYSV